MVILYEIYVLQETSNAKSELVLLEWTPRLCLHFVLYDMRLVSTLIIAVYGAMNYSLLTPILIELVAKLNEYKKSVSFLRWKFLSV